MKILIIQTAFIGDAILSTCLIEKLKEQHPACSIDFLLRKGNESLLDNHPHVNSVLIFDKKERKYRNLFLLIKKIRAGSYDYVINVQRFFTTGLITTLSRGKVKIGYSKNPLSFFFTHAVPHDISTDKIETHEVNRNLALIQSLGDTSFLRPKLYPSEEDYQKVPIGEDYVCMAPASVWFTKQLPEKKWCELINQLPDKYKVYLIGGKVDIALCQRIQEKTNHLRVEILAGKLSFLESAALIEHAKMTFANDSAPVHIASAMNAPVIEIFCSTVPEFGFGPLSDNANISQIEENLDCRPCGLHGKKECPKGHFKCADIDVPKILKTALP